MHIPAGSVLWCIGVHKIHDGMFVLGDLVLKDRIVIYNLGHQRVRWIDYDCSFVNFSSVPTSNSSPG
ncbi:hypothetical protein C5167_028701 [Papaver somniferum]|nr:hypothetical protein C5167_028701 [Papaver somniferum]